MRSRLLLFAILVFAQGVARADQASANADWQQFRNAYPYHIQTVALSTVHSDGHRTMIVSEPPPSVTFAGIRGLSPDFSSALLGTHGIGVDGWVKDMVIDLPPLSDTALAADVDRLQHTLFGTAYKAYALSIPSSPPQKKLSSLDLHVASADLASWLLPADPASIKDAPVNSIPGLIVAVLLLAWGIQRLLTARPVSAVLIILIATAALLGSSSSTARLILALAFVMVAILLFRRSRLFAGAVMACLTLVFLGVGIASRTPADTAKTHFTPLLGGQEVTCDDILHRGLSGVFLSRPAGLVVWSVSKSKPIDSLSTQIRQFALDTDMVVGAVSRDDQVVIVGRERTNDVSLLPPLRTETVLLLASAKEDELKQSYERTVLMAGRARDAVYGEQDWAPILLSPRLIDTEYGSLLNITDQLLKSWSQHGEVKYVRFLYPVPAHYPFDKGLMEHLGVDLVTFNWNTKGAGYVSKTGPYEIFALNRTASLPIDYLAEGRPDVAQAEDEAYNWYAGLSDPNLIRVVHYAALYQIFHHFGIHAQILEPQLTQPFTSLAPKGERFLRYVAGLSNPEMSLMGSVYNQEFLTKYLRPAHDALKLAVNGEGPFTIQQIAQVASDRSKMSSVLAGASSEDAANLQSLLGKLFQVAGALVDEDERSQSMQDYRRADTQHPGVWIRTPSVVESSSSVLVGGHNLGSKVTLLEADSSISAGKVAVRENADGQKVIHFNPADDARVGGTIRDAARDDSLSATDMEKAVNDRLPSVRAEAHEPAEGLGHINGIHPDPLRGLQMSHIEGGYTSFGWRAGNMVLGDQDVKVLTQLKGGSNQVMLLTRTGDGKYVIGMEGGQSIEASDQASAIDGFLELAADSPDKRVHLHTRGLDERQTQGFLSGTGRYTEDYDVVATREEDIDMDSLKAMMADKYDLKAARYGEITVSDADAKGIRMLSQDIEIPARASGLKGFILELRIFFSDLTGNLQELTAHIGQQVRAYLANFSEERDLRFAAAELTRRLQQDHVYGTVREVHIKMRKEARVAFYAYNVYPQGNPTGEGLAG